MTYVPKIFVNRSVEFPFRRLLTPVAGQANTVDVSRVPGTIFAVGDLPDAANLNAEFGKIKAETDAINTSLNGLTKKVDNTNIYTLLISEVGSGVLIQRTIPNLNDYKEVQLELETSAGLVNATSRIPVQRFKTLNSTAKQLLAMYGTSISSNCYYASDTSVFIGTSSGWVAKLYGIK